jgi:hypothetical protein
VGEVETRVEFDFGFGFGFGDRHQASPEGGTDPPF